MKYADRSQVLTPGALGLIDVLVYSANGMYDPDNTGVGHQPRGFDQLMAMYNHFVVIKSKLTATFTSRSGGVQLRDNVVVGVTLRDNAVVATDCNDYIEGRHTTFCQLAITATTQSTPRKCVSSFNNKFLGRSHPLSDPELKGSTLGNPAEQANFHIWAQTNDTTLNGEALNVLVYIEYIAVLIEPNQPTQS